MLILQSLKLFGLDDLEYFCDCFLVVSHMLTVIVSRVSLNYVCVVD